MKRLFPLALALFLLTLPVFAAVERADPAVKIYDYADLLTTEQAAALSAQAKDIVARRGMDVAIVTITGSGDLSPAAYADDFYDLNGFGTGAGYDGILLLVDMENRRVETSTHGLGQRIFYDRDLDRILDDIAPLLTAQRYDAAFARFLTLADAHIGKALGEKEPFGLKHIAVALLIGLAAGGIGTGIMVAVHKAGARSVPGAQTYLDSRGLVVTNRVDQFLHTHTSRVPIPKNNGGGGSGGGSTRTSSSGRSHGGRGRGF